MRNRSVAALVILLLLALSGTADADRRGMRKAEQRARLLRHEPEHVGSQACAEDPEGDTVSGDALDDVDVPEADIVRWCASYDEGVVLRLRLAEPTDPREHDSWFGFTTAMWAIDVTGDEEPEFIADYSHGPELKVRLYDVNSDDWEPRCETSARYRAGELVSGTIARACLGGRTDLRIGAAMLFDVDPEDEEGVVALDETPLSLHVRGETLPPGTAQREVRRLSGKNRFETAVALSQEAYPTGALRIYLVRADQHADTTAAAALSAAGPLLPVPPCGPIPEVILEEIRRLAPMEVVAVGGPDAICEDVVAQAAAA